ncbi:MAG: hypothetical protein QXT03_05645 [Desulfurococcaceae archaeon]
MKYSIYVYLLEDYFYRRSRYRSKSGVIKEYVYIYRFGSTDPIGIIHISMETGKPIRKNNKNINNNNNYITDERINKRPRERMEEEVN